MTIPENIINEIANERAAQDAQWGGLEHDREHQQDEWTAFIIRQAVLADAMTLPGEFNRERFVKIAALAVAALEANQ